MDPVEYRVDITNAAGSSLLAPPIGTGDAATGEAGWSEIRLSPRYKIVGSGSVTCRARPDWVAAAQAPEARVVVRRRGPWGDRSVEMSGPIEVPEVGIQTERDGLDGYGRITIRFASDEQRAAYKLVYPQPANPSTGQTATRYLVALGNAEDRMRTLFNEQCGPGARPERRLPGVVLGADQGIGLALGYTTAMTRDMDVAEALRRISHPQRIGGLGVGFRLVQVDNRIEFQTFAPRDLTGQVVFSRSMGNVVDQVHTVEAPTCTVAIVGDAAAGPDRVIRERVNTAALAAGWLRYEKFVDARSATSADEMDAAGDEVLKAEGPKHRLVMKVRETPRQRWRFEMWMGDQVSTIPRKGLTLTRTIIGAEYTITPAREIIEPILGEEGEILTTRQAEQLLRLERRIAQIEGAL